MWVVQPCCTAMNRCCVRGRVAAPTCSYTQQPDKTRVESSAFSVQNAEAPLTTCFRHEALCCLWVCRAEGILEGASGYRQPSSHPLVLALNPAQSAARGVRCSSSLAHGCLLAVGVGVGEYVATHELRRGVANRNGCRAEAWLLLHAQGFIVDDLPAGAGGHCIGQYDGSGQFFGQLQAKPWTSTTMLCTQHASPVMHHICIRSCSCPAGQFQQTLHHVPGQHIRVQRNLP